MRKEGNVFVDDDGRMFRTEPALPLKDAGKIEHMGWDIATPWAVDAAGVVWLGDAHANIMQPVSVAQALRTAAEGEQDARLRMALGRKPRMPLWARAALGAGWTPPEGWDPNQYDTEAL